MPAAPLGVHEWGVWRLSSAGRVASLEELVRGAPAAPSVPRLLYADATPEALAHGLATG